MTRPSVALGHRPKTKEQRMRLQQAVIELGQAIATGETQPEVVELQALAGICDDAQLPIEARRIRLWLAGARA